ncbi:hypothetical protein ACFU7X_03150 [Streptomyces chartreusis]|uniref:hypothetical protein n=1 Tax=Streptomyces chartreusis TaxID=1969 RepID=UPI0036801B14
MRHFSQANDLAPDSDSISDDELYVISGGIPQLGQVASDEQVRLFDQLQTPVLQERPTADPEMWF